MAGIDEPTTESGVAAQSRDRPNVSESAKRNLYQHVYKILSAAAFFLIALGTTVYHYLEDWSWVDSLYFSVVAVTTVGFGDLSPSTDASKLFTVLYILVGITLITTYLNTRFKYAAYKKVNAAVPGIKPDAPDQEEGS